MASPKPKPQAWRTIKIPWATYVTLASLRMELLYRGTDALPERLRPVLPPTGLAGTVHLALEVLGQVLRDEDVRRSLKKKPRR